MLIIDDLLIALPLLVTAWRAITKVREEAATNQGNHQLSETPEITATDYQDRSVLNVRGVASLTPDDRAALLWAADELKIPVDSLAIVIALESGWNPAATNTVPAAGLIQLTPGARLPGFESADDVRSIAHMSVADQLEQIVVPYYERFGVKPQDASPEVLYMLNFLPGLAGESSDRVIGVRPESFRGQPAGQGPGGELDSTLLLPGKASLTLGRVYSGNAGFDADQKGYFTIGDVQRFVQKTAAEAKGRRVKVDGSIIEAIKTVGGCGVGTRLPIYKTVGGAGDTQVVERFTWTIQFSDDPRPAELVIVGDHYELRYKVLDGSDRRSVVAPFYTPPSLDEIPPGLTRMLTPITEIAYAARVILGWVVLKQSPVGSVVPFTVNDHEYSVRLEVHGNAPKGLSLFAGAPTDVNWYDVKKTVGGPGDSNYCEARNFAAWGDHYAPAEEPEVRHVKVVGGSGVSSTDRPLGANEDVIKSFNWNIQYDANPRRGDLVLTDGHYELRYLGIDNTERQVVIAPYYSTDPSYVPAGLSPLGQASTEIGFAARAMFGWLLAAGRPLGTVVPFSLDGQPYSGRLEVHSNAPKGLTIYAGVPDDVNWYAAKTVAGPGSTALPDGTLPGYEQAHEVTVEPELLQRTVTVGGTAQVKPTADELATVKRGIREAVLATEYDPAKWTQITVGEYDLMVMNEPLAVAGLRLPTSFDDEVVISHVLNALPVTPAISNARWANAKHVYAKMIGDPAKGNNAEQIVRYNRMIGPNTGEFVDGFWKEVNLHPQLQPNGLGSMAQYGFRDSETHMFQQGNPASTHDRLYKDYSTTPTYVGRMALKNGVEVDLLDELAAGCSLGGPLPEWLVTRLRTGEV